MTRLKRPLPDLLRSLDACPAAVRWSRQYGTDWRRAWRECHRGDWLRWFVIDLGPELSRRLSRWRGQKRVFADWCGVDAGAVVVALEDDPDRPHPVLPPHTRALRQALRLGADLVRERIGEDEIEAALRRRGEVR